MRHVFKNHLLVIILFYLALLMQHAWVPGFFHDGYLYAEFGKNAANGKWLVPHLNEVVYSEFFHHLPFVFMLEGVFFKFFGASFLTARLFASLFSLLTLILLLKWVYEEKGEKSAFFTGAIFTLILPLIKKSRFPNLDLPLMLTTLASLKFYYNAYKHNLKKDWIFCGLFFGLGLLVKGPVGVFVPMVILFHLVVTKNTKKLFDIWPWCGLVLGCFLFCLWPLLLKLNGQSEIFFKWVDFVFFHTLKDGRGESSSSLTYILFLLKHCGPWFLLSAFSIKYYKKIGKNDPLYLLFLTTFLSILILLSFQRFKYSHYLIPVYPALAFLAAYSLQGLGDKIVLKIKTCYRGLAVLVVLILLIFPLTTSIKRDREIYKLKSYFEMANTTPKQWKIVNGVYPFWSLNNLASWHDLGVVQSVSKNSLKTIEEGDVVLIDSSVWKEIKMKVSGDFTPLYKFKKRKMVVIISNSLIQDDYMFLEK